MMLQTVVSGRWPKLIKDHTLALPCESVVRATSKVNGEGQTLTPRYP